MIARRTSLPARLWLLLLLGLVPIAAMILFTTHAGRAALDRLVDPAGRSDSLPGVTVENAVPPGRGLVVTSLRSGSEAAAAGIAVGDGVTAIDGRPIARLDQALGYLHKDRNRWIVLRIVHRGQARRVRLGRSEA